MNLLRSENQRVLLFVTVACFVPCGHDSAWAFIASDRWGVPAAGAAGERGEAVSLTWSLAPDGTHVRNRAPSGLISLLDASFQVDGRGSDLRSRPWFALVESAFERWEAVSGVTFEYEPNDDGAPHSQTPGATGVRGDVRLAGAAHDGPRGLLATSQFPDGGDVVLDSQDLAFLLEPAGNYRRFRNVLMHEVGHTLGLDHIVSSDAELLMEPAASTRFDGPQLDDIRGVQHLYGDPLEKANGGAGNDTIAHATDLGVVWSGAAIAIGTDPRPDLTVDVEHTGFVSLSGRSDRDVYVFDVPSAGSLAISLTPLGGEFRQGAPGDEELLTNASASSNLRLTVMDERATRLAIVDSHLHGMPEHLTDFAVSGPSRYFVEIAGTRDVVQLYSLSVSLESHPAPAPSSLATVMALFTAASSSRLTTRVMPTRRRRRI